MSTTECSSVEEGYLRAAFEKALKDLLECPLCISTWASDPGGFKVTVQRPEAEGEKSRQAGDI